MSFNETRKITEKVEGYLGRREGPYLYSLAKLTAGKGDVVEIGSFKGKSTIWLANGRKANPGEKVFAVDPHIYGTEQEFRQNIKAAGVDDVIIPIVKPSAEAVQEWSRSIGLLWIDGGHNYDEVRTDFISWEPFVSDGGVIALHDTYSWEGVRTLVDDEILTDDRFGILGQWDSICAVRKVSRVSYRDRVKRRVFACLRYLFNWGRSERRHWRALPRKILRGLSSPRPKD